MRCIALMKFRLLVAGLKLVEVVYVVLYVTGTPCPDDPTKAIADPSDCHYFIQCIGDQVYRTLCPGGLYFDVNNQICTYTTIGCVPAGQTPPPVTLSGGNGVTTQSSKTLFFIYN